VIVTDAEREEVRAHLERVYAGVFGPAEIAFHLSSHLGDAFADYACQVIAVATPAGGRVLDVGSGFGSFVVLARERGFDAVGTEVAPYEIAFARRRLSRLRPADAPEQIFLDGGIFNHTLDERRFDAITFWNVLEHVSEIRPLLERAAALLAPGGAVYVVCPNYAAFRREAHYQVPWRPFLSRAAAIRRLRDHGKDPAFFEQSIFQRTNWEVIRVCRSTGLCLYDRLNQSRMGWRTIFRSPRQFMDFFNPLRNAVELAARKCG
jgi:2-polyprenyl-3-methyl-5-hydroxy-6-metoxy-1,4-benzoquinol methylase